MKKLLTIVCTLAIACSTHICAQGKRTLLKNWTRSADAFAKAPTKENAEKAVENLKNYAATFKANMLIPSGTINRAKKLYNVKEFKKALNAEPALITKLGIVMKKAEYIPPKDVKTIPELKKAMDDIDVAVEFKAPVKDAKDAAMGLIAKFGTLLIPDKIKTAKEDTQALIEKYQKYTGKTDKQLMKKLAEALFYAKMDMSNLAKAKATIAMLNTLDKVDKKALEEEFIKTYIDANVSNLVKTLNAAKLINELKKADKKEQAKYLFNKAKDGSIKPESIKDQLPFSILLEKLIEETAKTYAVNTANKSAVAVAKKINNPIKDQFVEAWKALIETNPTSIDKVKELIIDISNIAGLKKISKNALIATLISKQNNLKLKPANLDNTKKDAVENVIRTVGKFVGVANADTAVIDNPYFGTIKAQISEDTKNTLKAAWDKVNAAPAPGGASGAKEFKDMTETELKTEINNLAEAMVNDPTSKMNKLVKFYTDNSAEYKTKNTAKTFIDKLDALKDDSTNSTARAQLETLADNIANAYGL